MPRAQSSANPARLFAYTAAGSDMDAALQAVAEAVAEACDRLRSAQGWASGVAEVDGLFGGDDQIVRVGDVDAQLSTLAADWQHLDGFVDDVARAFVTADGRPGPPGPAGLDRVVTVYDTRLAAAPLGFADRQHALTAAAEAARRLEDLLARDTEDVTSDQIQTLVARIARGQHDPAFAVAFSERLGVTGYVDAVHLIGEVSSGDDSLGLRQVGPDAIPAVEVLAATVTTALDTRSGIPTGRRIETDNDDLADDQRLSDEFVDDLVAAYRPDGQPTNIELSVLLRFTDPPTDVAVDIANNRLTPLLATEWPHPFDASVGNVWGEYGDPVSNYAEMLSRNPRASTLWLGNEVEPSSLPESAGDGTANIDLVLQRDTTNDGDGGRALADVVENGLAYGSGDGVSDEDDTRTRHLMARAIETVGRQDEIPNTHMPRALARGVAHNMDVIDQHINTNWQDNAFEPLPQDCRHAHDFLREVSRDDAAARTVRQAAYRFVEGQVVSAPTDPTMRTAELEASGRVIATVTEARANAGVVDLTDDRATREGIGALSDYAISLVPGLDEGNDALAVLSGDSLSSRVLGTDSSPVDDAFDVHRTALRRLDMDMASFAAVAAYESGTWSSDQIVEATGVDLFTGDPGDPDRRIKPVDDMSEVERQAYVTWVFSEEVAGLEGVARGDYNDVTAGAYRAIRRLMGEL